MRVVVPFAAENPKTRLGELLSSAERREFARAMCRDVLSALDETDHDVCVLSTAPLDVDVATTVDDRPLSAAVNAMLEDETPTAVVMADLPLVTPTVLSGLFDTPGEVVLAPGRGGGTNAIVSRHPDFRVDYHGVSFCDHFRAGRALDAHVETVDSFRLATDIDDPADLAEVLIHGDGAAREWLVAAGIELAVGEEGHPIVTR